ncbi:MAG: DNA repair protein RadA [Candidatus Delongbacteria bacterium]|nr:DNA repair protein RadA [Candidatus Delongbacteria bacterium]MCG2760477.1 DNA repair protein RadA [Candidatus Delongbacteria bacterium]
MAKTDKTNFLCTECGYDAPKWLGKCPSCGIWGSFKEFKVSKSSARKKISCDNNQPEVLKNIKSDDNIRTASGICELDRVLGGGYLKGMTILIGGDPGIGKSTLMLKYLANMQKNGRKSIYVSGEESPHQIKHRAERINANEDMLYIFCENNLKNITDWVEKNIPEIVVIDSIQTIFNPDEESSPGSAGQLRAVSSELIMLAKKMNFCLFLIGHVTKDGFIAGPKMIEHMVDTVLYFEGDRYHRFRILRTVKNRFGSTNEIGMFEMDNNGLVEVKNPSQYFLNEDTLGNSGTSITASLEGTRPLLIEIQALVTDSNFGNPQRNCVGYDIKRLSKILAVLDKKMGFHISNQDIFLNITGGGKLTDPGADLSVAIALISSFKDIKIPLKSVFCGEVGLNGEIRAVSGIEMRINECVKLGFKYIYAPKANYADFKKISKNGIFVSDLNELVSLVLI